MQQNEIAKKHGNVIRQRYGALAQRLLFRANNTKWTTKEDLDIFAEEGRFWAEKIIDAIQFMARIHQRTPGSFLNSEGNDLDQAHVVIDVVETCERCLERLRPEVLFADDPTAALGMGKPS